MDLGLTAGPEHHRSDHVSRAGGVVVEGSDQRLWTELELKLLVQLSKRGIERGLSGFEASAGERPLAGVGAHRGGPAGEDHPGSPSGTCDAAVKAGPLRAGNG
jgi:hypothetical protein